MDGLLTATCIIAIFTAVMALANVVMARSAVVHSSGLKKVSKNLIKNRSSSFFYLRSRILSAITYLSISSRFGLRLRPPDSASGCLPNQDFCFS